MAEPKPDAFARRITKRVSTLRMSDLVRWSVTVSRDTDVAVRALLAARGRRIGGLSRFVEEAVNREIMRCTMSDIRSRNAGYDAGELAHLIGDELRATRGRSWPTRDSKSSRNSP